MRKERNCSSGSEQSAGNSAGNPKKRESRLAGRRATIGQSTLVERARSFDPNFNASFDERKFDTWNEESARRSASFSSQDDDDDYAYLFVSPTLTEQRRQSLQGTILANLKDEETLVQSRRQSERAKAATRFPKRNTIGPNMKALLDASNHRRITSVDPVQLPMTAKKGVVDSAPITKHAVKLKNVRAPKLHVNPQTYQPPVHTKTEWQRALLRKAIQGNFVLKNHLSKTEEALVEAMETMTVPKGEILAKQGESSEQDDNFYVLEEGKVEFLVDNECIKTAEAGEAFGEERLLLRVPNEATVKAVLPSVLLRLNQTEYRAIVAKTVTENLPAAVEEKVEVMKPSAMSRPPRPTTSGQANGGKRKPKTTAGTTTTKKTKAPDTEIFDPTSLEKHSLEFQRQAKIRTSVQKHATNKDDLEFISVLGEGQFGEVWLVAATLPDVEPTRQEFALKIQSKDDEEGLREDAVADIRREIDVLQKIHHPFIVHLVHTYENNDSIDMLLGLIPGGELWDQIHIENEETGEWASGISEHRAQFLSFVLADTFAFLHSREFLFRDLKPENIMIDQDGYPVLVDFGFAKYVPKGGRAFTFCGTPQYVAPEIIRNLGQSAGVDHWALGVVIHEMIAGENPFFWDEMGQVELYQAITDEEPSPIPDEKKASSQVRDFITKLLIKDPEKRLGSKSPNELLMHPWFKDMPSIHDVRAKKIKAPTNSTVDYTWTFVEGYEPEIQSIDNDEDDVVGQEGELLLSPAPSTKSPNQGNSSKWTITPTSMKGKLKGYYVSPKTPLQRTTSKERRDLLGQKMLDVVPLDADEDIGLLKSPARPQSKLKQMKEQANDARKGIVV